MPVQIPHIMGKSLKSRRVLREIKKLSLRDTIMLIYGEKGCCKELIAKAIHDNSPRREGPFVRVDLTSIPRDLAEKELFGYGEYGPSEAAGEARSRIESANGGTLFLDGISEMDMALQDKLCSFLQRGESKLPDQDSCRSDVRVVCATCRNLKEGVDSGMFRKELYTMLNAVHIRIPSLRERKEDILPLAQYFLGKTVERFATGDKELSKEAEDFLLKYDWPGDVRELEEMIKKAVLLSSGQMIERKDLVLGDVNCCSIREFLEEKLKRYLKEMTQLDNCNLYNTVLSEVERSLISIVLKETGGNQLKAAKTLGINRNTLRTKIKDYKIRL
jgi:two-component system, NtrC family, nitrogen regulation response regulator GlnG